MSRRDRKRRTPAGGRGFEKTQPGKLQADPTLVMLLSQAIEMEDRHCLMVVDSIGQHGVRVTPEFMEACRAAGERSQQVCPENPAAAIRAALMVLLQSAGGVH
jgi:hypothetical protein